jgi:hypothetical protein
VFLVNVIGALELRNVFGLFVPERWLERQRTIPAKAQLL